VWNALFEVRNVFALRTNDRGHHFFKHNGEQLQQLNNATTTLGSVGRRALHEAAPWQAELCVDEQMRATDTLFINANNDAKRNKNAADGRDQSDE